MNLAASLAHTAREHPHQVALRQGDRAIRYADLDERSARVASLLAGRGITPGDRVGVMLPNVVEFAAVYYGVLRAGGVVVPMNPLLKAREVAYYLADSGARLIVAWHAIVDEVTEGAAQAGATALLVDPATFPSVLAEARPAYEVVDREPSDTAVLLYTSGTTGRPKGAELTHANLATNVEVTLTDLLELGAHDVVFGGLPLFHSFGQTVTLNTAVAAGATLVLLPRFDPVQALGLLAEHRVTVFAGVPTMYSALLGVPDAGDYDVSALRVCVSGGAAMPVEVLKQFEKLFGTAVLEGYGLSETSPVASFNQPGRSASPARSAPRCAVSKCGSSTARRTLPHGEVGEIAIRGHNVMKGYWNRPEASAQAIDADGWFKHRRPGPRRRGRLLLHRRPEEGPDHPRRLQRLPARGREVLYEHPDVVEAAVVGVPHPELGEEVAAAVALKPGATATVAELRDFVKDQVAAYKYPRRVWLVDDLPKGPTGKILKREIHLPDKEIAR